MTVDRKYQLLIHIWDRIFNMRRFRMQNPDGTIRNLILEIFQKKLIPGEPELEILANQFSEYVQRINLDSCWAPWIVGNTAFARTFNAELPDPNGKVIKVGILVGFDINLDLGGTAPYPIRIMEQNPFKLKEGTNQYSQTAVLAQRGTKLAWVLRNVPKTQLAPGENPFLGKIQDGEFIQNEPRADVQKTMRPLPELGASLVSNDVRQDQYNTDHLNRGNGWESQLPDIDPNEVPIGIV